MILVVDRWEVTKIPGRAGFAIRASFEMKGSAPQIQEGDTNPHLASSSFSLNFHRLTPDNITQQELLDAALKAFADAKTLKKSA
ncbi:hypothetical protein [Acetobacter persici]|uniref:hypothetical protein n=1 Tax=Acetobacter persici TaxID=1076596 RepID=UPI0039EC2246